MEQTSGGPNSGLCMNANAEWITVALIEDGFKQIQTFAPAPLHLRSIDWASLLTLSDCPGF